MEAAKAMLDSSTKAIFIADRGGDIFEMFAQKREPNFESLIRACHNRKIEGCDKRLFERLEEANLLGYVDVEVGRAPNRQPRIAKLELRAMETVIVRGKEKCTVNVVLAKETNHPNVLKSGCLVEELQLTEP